MGEGIQGEVRLVLRGRSGQKPWYGVAVSGIPLEEDPVVRGVSV